ncbi:18869_t:CDS:2, partial [Racocetra persica]
RDIVNHSGRSTPITFLFQKGVPTVTTMSLTGHKSESSYRIYARPSQQQKEEALSLLINNVGTLPLKDSETSNNSSSSSEDLNDTRKIKNTVSTNLFSSINPSVMKPFRSPLRNIKNKPHSSQRVSHKIFNKNNSSEGQDSIDYDDAK